MSRMQKSEAQSEIREGAAEAQKHIREVGGQIRDAATEKYGELRDQAEEYYEHGRKRAMELEQGLEDYVREKPIQSLLMAAGVGVLLGILWKRS